MANLYGLLCIDQIICIAKLIAKIKANKDFTYQGSQNLVWRACGLVSLCKSKTDLRWSIRLGLTCLMLKQKLSLK